MSTKPERPAEGVRAAGRAFDALAPRYDRDFGDTPLGLAWRREVWRRAAIAFAGAERILDLGCGTGLDAAHLAAGGLRVDGIDASRAMLDRARVRLARPLAEGRVRLFHRGIEELTAEPELDGPYDGVLSNFGALNCVPALSELARDLAGRLRPGAACLLVVMGPVCLWEILAFGRRLDRRALRRLGRARASLAGHELPLGYPSPAALTRTFAPDFRRERLGALGLMTPPTDLAASLQADPSRLRGRMRLERAMAGLPGAAWLSDHYVLELRRSAPRKAEELAGCAGRD